MGFELLLSRIDERLTLLKLSERKACLNAGVGLNAIRHIRVRGHAPKADTLAKLAGALGVPPTYLLEAAAAGTPQPDLQPRWVMQSIYVRGAVQAGAWKAALEWEATDWYAIQVPSSKKYPGMTRFGLEVRGTSMDARYPDGSVVLCIKLYDLERQPIPGEDVVVLQRNPLTQDFEATVKEYQIDAKGRHILWPRSSDPEFQTPIILPMVDIPMGDGTEEMPRTASAGALDFAGVDDVYISALVVGMYRES